MRAPLDHRTHRPGLIAAGIPGRAVPALLAGVIGAVLGVSGCGSKAAGPLPSPARPSAAAPTKPSPEQGNGRNVYAGAMSTHVSPELAGIPERVYVPNELGRSVDVIDPS